MRRHWCDEDKPLLSSDPAAVVSIPRCQRSAHELHRRNRSLRAIATAHVPVRGAMGAHFTDDRVCAPDAIMERFFGSLRRECLDHILLLGERHLRGVLREYVDYFNERRPHQGLGQTIPKGTANDNVVAGGEVAARPILGGLHHDYRRAA